MLQEASLERDVDIDEVIKRELRLLQPEVRHRAEQVRDLLDEDFREIGASGQQRLDRESTVEALVREQGASPIDASELGARRLSPGVILITYRSRSARGQALRSSIWVRSERGEWRLAFHQGTPVPI
ncbi:MAG: DUF4440 domain-containing protein [Candidatus Dormiibacterota bacterium]